MLHGLYWFYTNSRKILKLYFGRKGSNGLRYPRWGGRRDAVQLEKCWGVEKGLESRQNPQRRVHALLANLLADQNLCEERRHRKLDWILPATLLLTKTQKLYANQNACRKKTNFTLTKTTAETRKYFMLTRTIAEKEWPLLLPKPMPKKEKPILKTYKANREQSRSREIQPIKTTAD